MITIGDDGVATIPHSFPDPVAAQTILNWMESYKSHPGTTADDLPPIHLASDNRKLNKLIDLAAFAFKIDLQPEQLRKKLINNAIVQMGKAATKRRLTPLSVLMFVGIFPRGDPTPAFFMKGLAMLVGMEEMVDDEYVSGVIGYLAQDNPEVIEVYRAKLRECLREKAEGYGEEDGEMEG